MKSFVYILIKNIGEIFSKKYIVWHILAILLTYFIVILGVDWQYFQFFKENNLNSSFAGAAIGGVVPIIAPLVILLFWIIKKRKETLNLALVLIHSAITGSIVSSFYKALTGRAHPDISGLITSDISNVFHFGFMKGGVFWGWPSSHTTIAFAMAFALINFYPKSRTIKIISIAYALFIGISVSINIHWLSDFLAGIIFGVIIGVVIGKSFYKNVVV